MSIYYDTVFSVFLYYAYRILILLMSTFSCIMYAKKQKKSHWDF